MITILAGHGQTAERRLHLRRIQKIPALQMNIEIEPAQIGKIVAYTHLELSLVISDPIVGDLRKGIIARLTAFIVPEIECLDPVERIIVIDAVRHIQCSLQFPPAEVFACSDTQSVPHAPCFGLHPELVADLGPFAFVIQVSDNIPRTGVLRRSIQIQYRIERCSGSHLEIERHRTIELPIGYGCRPERFGRKVGRQCQRSDRIVDFGAQPHRIGHVGRDGEFEGLRHLRNIGFGYLDLLRNLCLQRRQTASQHGNCRNDNFSHGYFCNFSIRAFASATMPSSAGE